MSSSYDDFARYTLKVEQEAALKERARIIAWIETNRSIIALEPGKYRYQDLFNSTSLIAFIKGETK